MSVQIRPLGDRVIVKPVEEKEITIAGGKLVLPDTAKEKPQQGEVLALGADVESDLLKEGDIVIYAKYAGTNFKNRSGDEVLILREDDLLAILAA
ncbi:MAG TPA: co-chaperone GroES [Thermoflexia bacterium]|nr:co-chaperone GroES [Thermoflexia bacterium]